MNGEVIEINKAHNDNSQLWKKGVPNADGYFTLKNEGLKKFLTAKSPNYLMVDGRFLIFIYNTQW